MTPVPHTLNGHVWFDEVYSRKPHLDAIRSLRDSRLLALNEARFSVLREALSRLPRQCPSAIELGEDAVTIGRKADLSSDEHRLLESSLRAFCPWKKGPFSIFGIDIDAEWRSDWKWQRVRPEIDAIKGKRIADVGCHNGYYMLRMAAENPEVVVGFEPMVQHLLTYELLQTYVQKPFLVAEPLGVEHLDLYPRFFDCILLLGILYHHTDPVGLLRKSCDALSTGGQLIVDCQGIPGSDPVALVPQGRYAGASGIWFLPTQKTLEHWLLRAGFRDIKCFYAAPLSIEEQRATPWAELKSLEQWLSPNRQYTIEGYQAPWRFYLSCRK